MIKENKNLHDRIDPEPTDALAAVPKVNGRVSDLSDLEGTRALIRLVAAQGERASASNTAVSVEEHEASRSGDPPVPLRLFRPANARGTLPAILRFHGGGQVLGFAAQEDAYLKPVASEVGCIVISVDYRFAPEARAPAAAQDGLEAWRWLSGEAGPLGADPERLGIAGASGGGGVAAATALMIRDEGAPMPLPITELSHDRRPKRDLVRARDQRPRRLGPGEQRCGLEADPRRRCRRPGRVPLRCASTDRCGPRPAADVHYCRRTRRLPR